MTRPILAAEFAAPDVDIDNCWKRIGIEGDKSCPELERHAHCRNCPAFSLAAAALLDRELPGDSADAVTSRFGGAEAADQAETESAMIFRVGSEWFALPTLVLDEIIEPRPVHSLPHRRNSGLLGLVNVRGELVVCVSIAELLIGTATGMSAEGRLIVARHASGRLVLPVDEVLHTHHYSPGELQPLPATVARSPSNFTKGLLSYADKIVGVLDERPLFDALNRSLT